VARKTKPKSTSVERRIQQDNDDNDATTERAANEQAERDHPVKDQASDASPAAAGADTVDMHPWADDFRDNPSTAGPRAVTRCADLAKKLLAMIQIGFGDGDEDADAKRKWIDALLELRWIVALAEGDTIAGWVDAGRLSTEAAEALIDANNRLQAPLLGWPGKIDAGKRMLAEPLERFLELYKGGPAPRSSGGIPEPPRPHWDRVKRTLYLGDEIVKEYAQAAANQHLILEAFNEQEWRLRIDDPLKPGKLKDTVYGLNKHQGPRRIRFSCDGTGKGIIWVMLD
jgi:hypothetical protein